MMKDSEENCFGDFVVARVINVQYIILMMSIVSLICCLYYASVSGWLGLRPP